MHQYTAFFEIAEDIIRGRANNAIDPEARILLIEHSALVHVELELISRISESADAIFTRLYESYASMARYGIDILNPVGININHAAKFRDESISSKVRTIPTLHLGSSSPESGLEQLFAGSDPDMPKLIVMKNPIMHQGKSLTVYSLDEAMQILKKHDIPQQNECVIQPLIYSSSDDGYQREFRVLFLGDEPVLYYEKKAKSPLLDLKGRLIEPLPSLSRVLTNGHQGAEVALLDHSKNDQILAFAKEVFETYKETEVQFRKKYNVPDWLSNAKMLSVDVMVDRNQKPYLMEVHTMPGFDSAPGRYNIGKNFIAQKTISERYDAIFVPMYDGRVPDFYQGILDAASKNVFVYDTIFNKRDPR
ncbi:MAG: hypothetical protein NDI94_05955 [Candidatus Woesearchaeota archaeon]|nr:hypothetical protein [Candidatus Woesearchaeota archaeon]